MGLSGLSIGLSGLLTAQKALETIGHNIVNASTEGYSRQELSLAAAIPNQFEFGLVGQGVTIEQIIRTKDDLLDTQIRNNNSLLANAEIQADSLRNLEFFLNELSETGLSIAIEGFFKSLQRLSIDPEQTSSRNELLQAGINLSNAFNLIDDQIKQLQFQTSQKILSNVNEINTITSEIVALNKEIAIVEVGGQGNSNANDARDKRNTLLARLSKLGDIRVIENDNGTINVLFGGTSLAVDGGNNSQLETFSTGPRTVGVSGSASMNRGELKGLLDLQDVTISKYIGKLDSLASSIIQEINNIHSEGVGLNGGATSLTSTNVVSSSSTALSLSSNNLPFIPSVTTYATGTVASSFSVGDGFSTVTGTGTAFTSNVNTGDMIELGGSGDFYKVIGVNSDTSLRVEGEITTGAGLATNVTDGNLYITVEDSSGGIVKTSVAIESGETLDSLATKINNVTNLTASVSSGLLTITSANGHKFRFTKAMDADPGSISGSTVSLSGNYNGSDNDVFTLTVQDAGTGSIGTGSAVIRVTDSSGAVLADLDVGSSYTQGDVLQIADGVSVSFGSGALTANDTLWFDVTDDPDTQQRTFGPGLEYIL